MHGELVAGEFKTTPYSKSLSAAHEGSHIEDLI